jgi:hypothetical protein
MSDIQMTKSSVARKLTYVRFCEHIKEISGFIESGNFLTNWATIRLSRTLFHVASFYVI